MSETELGGTETAGKGIVSEEEVGGTDTRDVQTGVGVGNTDLGGSVTARTVVVYDILVSSACLDSAMLAHQNLSIYPV